MITLTIGNSYSKLTGLSPMLEKELREALSYVVGGSGAFFSGFGPIRRSLLSKKGEFPSGLLSRVADFLVKHPSIDLKVIDNRFKPLYQPHRVRRTPEPYQWQLAALNAAVEHGRGVISAVTGSGKSRVVRMICEHYGLKALVIVPSLGIKAQLQESLRDLPLVRVENIDSNALNRLTDFDILIIDEAHHSSSATYRRLNKNAWGGIYHRYYLTATAFRNDEEETILFESVVGDVIYTLTYNEAVANDYIVPIESYYLDVPKQKTDAITYQQVYNQLVVNNKVRNELIAYLALKLQANDSPTLILVKEVQHGKILSEMTGIDFVNGQDEESRDYIRQFNAGEIKALLGTEGVLAEGIDTKAAEWIIVGGLGKAKSRLMQAIGRVLRRDKNKQSGKVVLIKDKSHRFLARHFSAQVAILKEVYNSLPEKIEL